MEWINIHAPMLRAPEYIGSEPISRATWFNVLAYCCEQENGGRIVGGAQWKDRQWQQTCGVTRQEVMDASSLLIQDGDDVLVWRYPIDKEIVVKEQREAGKRGGRPRKEPSENPGVNHRDNPPETTGVTQTQNGREGKGREEKGKEVPPKPPRGRSESNLPTTPQSQAIATMFHRKLTTPWTDPEIRAYKKIGKIEEEDLKIVSEYYAAHWPPNRDQNILRHDLKTFLNNFPGEVDRARTWKGTAKQASLPLAVEHSRWRDFLTSMNRPYEPQQFAPAYLKTDFSKWINGAKQEAA